MHESELKPDQLYRHCRLDELPFETTDDFDERITPSSAMVDQERAEQALHFGVGMRSHGYNVFALGEQGTGKHTFIRDFLKRRAAGEAIPPDICYVNNFEQPHKPKLLTLKAGQGRRLAGDMRRLIEDVRSALQAAFENEEYQNRAQSIARELQERQKHALEELRRKAREKNLMAIPTPNGLAFSPAREEGEETLSPDEYEQLPEEEKRRIEHSADEMQLEAQRVARNIPQWQRELRDKQRAFNREVTEYTVNPLIGELREKYDGHEQVLTYLESVRGDLVENARDLMGGRTQQNALKQALKEQQEGDSGGGGDVERRYRVNVLVDHGDSRGAPVIHEDNPTYQNLFGRIEHLAQMGALTTDFNMIRPGAVHRANGGYLMLDALKVVREPFAWEGLKRTLRSGELKIEPIGQMYSLISTVSLEPGALPLELKVILTGIPRLYYLMREVDPEFGELFKVPADFDHQVDRSRDNQHEFARLIAGAVRREELLPFRREAVARVIERGSRLVGDTHKISIHMDSMTTLLRESDYWARQNGRGAVEAGDVQQAIDSRIFRSDRLRERVQEQIERDIMLIDTDGARVGRVNGLAVVSLGDFSFGRPNRITARIRLGNGQVIDIEREVAMGGPIHSKGVLILAGFLGGRYALDTPLSLSASLVFEQSYGGVEGDSASSAELYALLSAVADVPVSQAMAVTGSVNQYGQVQPIGGVNEKVEGFFDLCRARGLNGWQGVMIPASNVQHLMLRRDVVEAVEAGQFHVHAVASIDQGLEILSGMSAGQADENGRYPPDTFNGRVQQRLEAFADKRRRFIRETRGAGQEGPETGSG